MRRADEILDEPVAVEVAIRVDPFERSVDCRQQTAKLGSIERTPADQFTDDHHEQRGRVGGAVVRRAVAERERFGIGEPQLVKDATRLLLRVDIDRIALKPGECVDRPPPDRVVEHHRHVCGE